MPVPRIFGEEAKKAFSRATCQITAILATGGVGGHSAQGLSIERSGMYEYCISEIQPGRWGDKDVEESVAVQNGGVRIGGPFANELQLVLVQIPAKSPCLPGALWQLGY